MTSAEGLPCIRLPRGWTCSRGAGHNGPCAARPVHRTGWRLLLAAAWRPALLWLMYTAAVVVYLWAVHHGVSFE